MEKRANLDRVPFSRFFFCFLPPLICHVPHSCPATTTPVRHIYPLTGLHTKLQGRALYIFLGSLFALSFLFLFFPTKIDLPTNFFWVGEGAS
jgi:hypothetical protein